MIRLCRRAGRALTTLAALAAAAACGGTDTQPTAPPDGGGAGQVRGVVADEKTGAGVPNLIVALLRGGSVVDVAPTAADGRFDFPGVDAGAYTLRLTGFDVAGVDLRFTAFTPVEKEITVGDAGVDVPIAAVGLVPARVVGYVRCGGQPAPGVSLRVIGGAVDTTVATSAIGRYAATNLYAGHYAVIPLDAPCGVAGWGAAETKVGQEASVDFSG